jgi:CxxC motif-containing protein
MKNKIMKYLGICLFLLLAGNILLVKHSSAASATIDITTDTHTVNVGDDVYIYITIDSKTEFGDFEANLTYDDDILEYQSGASIITGSSGFLKFSDVGITEGSNNRKYTLKFEAIKVGTCDIAFQNRAMVYDIEGNNEMSVSSNVLTMEVKAAQSASDNAYLKSLKTIPSELTPNFDKKVNDYSLKVPNEVDKLIINAIPEDTKSTVSISGNDFLKEGENKVIVTVLAESGNDIEYNITVNREEKPEENSNQEEAVNGIIPGSFEFKQIEKDVYAIFNHNYKLVEPASDIKIPQGYMKTELRISEITIAAYVSEKDMQSEFLLIYAMNEAGEAGFYQYDRVEKTFQRYVANDVIGNQNNDNNDEDTKSSQEDQMKLNNSAIVIALLSAFSVLMIIIVISLLIKSKRRR